jgi:UDPglucose 6-dehydrogenase
MGSEKPLRITVAGLWHLGSVTAACCARHFQVVGLDDNADRISELRLGKPPLLEPGLAELIAEGLHQERLAFESDPSVACANADVLWLTYDTPVDDQDQSDVALVRGKLRAWLAHLADGALVLISSQLPVGTCRELETEFPQFHFACSPENLRLGRAIDAFTQADRVVVGFRDNEKKAILQHLFEPFTPTILWMRTESAEMVKHGLNAFLALSITYINEIARLCERTGADAREVAAGLKTDQRIGPKAYLGPGGPFAGGTLARDVVVLTELGDRFDEGLQVIPAIKRSNDQHRHWALQRLEDSLGSVSGKSVAILGLTYKPNTDTLRRSAAVELCGQLLNAGAAVRAFDPVVKALPTELAQIALVPDIAAVFKQADAAVVCTEWPAFSRADWTSLVPLMKRPLIIDANCFLDLKSFKGIEYLCVGGTNQ